jgi:ribosomal-protein-alanine N-acetyltransferase
MPDYHFRAMHLDDLDAVLAIDRLSFPTPAQLKMYQYELTQNEMAHYQVMLDGDLLIGYSGFWMIADECHISTIAIHPDWRGRKLGEALLLYMLDCAREHKPILATLEVRRSNTIAQALYLRHNFAIVGERRRYYKDTNEDAILMTREPLDD